MENLSLGGGDNQVDGGNGEAKAPATEDANGNN